MGLEITLLGPLQVSADGVALTIGRRREQWLLVLLAARAPGVVAADQLIEELWDGDAPTGAATTLRSYVSSCGAALREHGHEQVILTRGRGYALDAEVAVDAQRFAALIARARAARETGDRAAEAARLDEALALSHGRDSADQQIPEAVELLFGNLESQRLDALWRWSEAQLSMRRPAEVAAALAAECDAHPDREDLWAVRMRALYRTGRHVEALQAYQTLYRRLRDELGIEPGPQLRALEAAILRQDPELDDDPRSGAGGAATLPVALRSPARGRFVGRRHALAAVQRAAELARSGAGTLLLVSGEAGAGKTRLAAEWAQQESARGHTVLFGRCGRQDTIPFQPFVEALASDADLSDLRAGGVAAEPDPELARWQLFDAISRRFLARAATTPLTLILDDVHWADASSLELLRHLARRAGQAPILLLLTARNAEAPAVLAQVTDDPGRVTRLELDGLSRDEVALLVTEASPAPPDALVDEIHALSGGNPLLVRQILTTLELDQRHADVGEGGASGGGGGEQPWTISDGIGELVTGRLRALDDGARELLEVAALLGDEFAVDELEALPWLRTDGDLFAVLERALAQHLIIPVSDDGERFRFAHDALRQAVLRRIGRPRLARLHEQIADALSALPDPGRRRAIALAEHYASAARPGHVEAAARWAITAAEVALDQLAFEQAAVIASRGLECLALSGDAPSRARCELRLLLARARLLCRSIDGCQEAALLAGADADALELAEALAQAAILGSYLNRVGTPHPEIQALCERALAALGPDQTRLSAQVLAGLADYVAEAEGDAPAALELAARAAALARGSGDRAATHRALFVRGDLLEITPQLDERRLLADELERSALRAGDTQAEVNALQLRALACLQAGDLAGFDAATGRIEQLRDQISYWYTELYALLWRGMRALLDGRLDEVEPHAEAMLAYAQNEPNVFHLYVGQLFCLRWEQGRMGELLDALVGVIAANPGLGVFRCALAMAHAELGDAPAARELLGRLRADGFASIARDSTWMISLAALAQAAVTAGDRDSAPALIELLSPYRGLLLIGTRGLACVSSADRLLGALHDLLGDSARAQLLLRDGAALERRLGSPGLLARSEAALARL